MVPGEFQGRPRNVPGVFQEVPGGVQEGLEVPTRCQEKGGGLYGLASYV